VLNNAKKTSNMSLISFNDNYFRDNYQLIDNFV